MVELADKALSKSNRPRATSTSGGNSPPPSPQISRVPQAYDPCALFLLEIIVSLAAREPGALDRLWGPAFEHLSKILSNSPSFSPLFVERAVAGVLRLQATAVARDDFHEQFFLALDLLRSLPSTIMVSVAEPMVRGICRIVTEHSQIFRCALMSLGRASMLTTPPS